MAATELLAIAGIILVIILVILFIRIKKSRDRIKEQSSLAGIADIALGEFKAEMLDTRQDAIKPVKIEGKTSDPGAEPKIDTPQKVGLQFEEELPEKIEEKIEEEPLDTGAESEIELHEKAELKPEKIEEKPLEPGAEPKIEVPEKTELKPEESPEKEEKPRKKATRRKKTEKKAGEKKKPAKKTSKKKIDGL